MNIRNGQTLNFDCEFINPFHITRNAYGNLLTCAPFIPGSTLRGAVLGYWVQKVCSSAKIEVLKKLGEVNKISDFHGECDQRCPVKSLFERSKPNIIFSFGNILDAVRASVARITLSRESKVVAEGKLVNVEVVRPGTPFSFEVTLFNSDSSKIDMLCNIVQEVGELVGIGKFKNVGFGRFIVKDISRRDVEEDIKAWMRKLEGSNNREVTFKMLTPLIMSEDGKPFSLQSQELARILSRLLLERFAEISGFELGVPSLSVIGKVEANIKPEFMHRYSLELAAPDSRLVAGRDSKLSVRFTQIEKEGLMGLLVLGSLFGIGEWRNFGYGRFEIKGVG